MKEYRMSEPVLLFALKKIYGRIGAISGKKILVIRDLEVALMLSVRNAVVYITDDPRCAELFRKNTEAGMGNDDVVIFINKWTNKLKFTKVFEKMGMKFNVAVMNPPYDRNLHLKILEKVIPIAEKTVNISPVRWLQDPFAPYSTRSDYCKFEDSISKKIESLDVITAKDASKLFDASFIMNLGVYVCSDKGGYAYQHNDPLITKIIEKTMENSWAPYSQKKFYDEGCIQKKPYAMNTAAIMGGNSIMCNKYSRQLNVQLTAKTTIYNGGNGCAAGHFEFDSDTERQNFYNCYTHDFMIWFYSIWRVDNQTKLWKVPYFGDYTHPWKLKDFFKWFDMTKEEQSRVIKEIRQMRHEKRQ